MTKKSQMLLGLAIGVILQVILIHFFQFPLYRMK